MLNIRIIYAYTRSKNRLLIILTTITFALYQQPTFHLLTALEVGYIKYLRRLYYYSSYYSSRDILYFSKQLSLSYTRISYYQYLPNYILIGPPPVYKYSFLYTFLSSFLLPYKSQRCLNTPPQSLLRDLLVDVAIQIVLDNKIGKRGQEERRSLRYVLVEQRHQLYYGCLISYTYRPPPVYKYSLYTFLSSFLPYKSQQYSNTPPQSLLMDLLVNIAIQTVLDKETGEREDRKDGGTSSKCQSSNVNVQYIKL